MFIPVYPWLKLGSFLPVKKRYKVVRIWRKLGGHGGYGIQAAADTALAAGCSMRRLLERLAADAHGCTRIENKMSYPCLSVSIRGSNWVRFYQYKSCRRFTASAGPQGVRRLFAKRPASRGVPSGPSSEGSAPNAESGFALLLVFLMAAVVAISLYMEIPRVAFEAQRQKELLLIDRGEQYKRAIQVFFINNKRYPASMDELKNLNGRRYLRQQYVDPMTGKSEWRLVHINGGVFTDSLLNASKQGQTQSAQNQQGQAQPGQAPLGGITGGSYVGEGQQFIGAAANPQQSVNFAMRRRASDGGGQAMPDQTSGAFPPQTAAAGNGIGGAYATGGSPDQTAPIAPGVAPGAQSQTAPGSFPMAPPNPALDPNSAAQAYAATAMQAIPGTGQGGGVGIAPTNFAQAQTSPGNYYPSAPAAPGFPAAGPQPSLPFNPTLPPGIQPGFPFQGNQQIPGNFPGSQQPSSYVGGSQSYIGGGSYVGGQSPIAGGQSSASGGAPFAGQNLGTALSGAPVNSQFGGVSPLPIAPSAYPPAGGFPPSGYMPAGGFPPTPAPSPYSTQPGAQGISPGFPQPGMQTGAVPGQPGTPGQSPASQMIWNILTNPRTNVGQGGAAQNAQIGGGIAGIASKSEDQGIMIYDDRSKYNEWEFVFDFTKYRPPPNPLGGSVGTPASQLGSINPAPTALGGISGAGGLNMGAQPGPGAPGFGNSGPQGGLTPFGPNPSMPGSPAPGAGGPFPPAGQTGLPELRMGQP